MTAAADFTSDKKSPVIEAAHLYKSFGENIVLRDFSLQVFPGENVVVMGRSGTGKTVLIKCIIGLTKPQSGELKVFGKEVFSLSKYELNELRRRIGFVFQSSALYDSMTVRQNLEFPMRWKHELSMDEKDKLVREMLHNVGLEDSIDLMPAELSGGMRKRIGIARSLILKPEIVLYDEPTTGLDAITAEDISQLMMELQKKYQTGSVIITHDLQLAKETGNRIIFLIDGTAYAMGTFEELAKSDDPKIKPFFKRI